MLELMWDRVVEAVFDVPSSWVYETVQYVSFLDEQYTDPGEGFW